VPRGNFHTIIARYEVGNIKLYDSGEVSSGAVRVRALRHTVLVESDQLGDFATTAKASGATGSDT
jgi:hypothetical protein